MKKGVFCVEGTWERHRLQYSYTVRPILETLSGYTRTRFVHRDVTTQSDLQYCLNQWTLKRYSGFPILYLAFHGDPGVIQVGPDTVSLDHISDMLSGKCQYKVIFFGTCETVRMKTDYLKDVLDETKAMAVIGYANVIPWIKSTAFDLIVLDELLMTPFTKQGMLLAAQKLKKMSKPFYMGFRIVTKYD